MSIDDATTAANDRLADSEDMIVCVDVDKFYGDFQALKGVTATIKEGEVAVVCGVVIILVALVTLGLKEIAIDGGHDAFGFGAEINFLHEIMRVIVQHGAIGLGIDVGIHGAGQEPAGFFQFEILTMIQAKSVKFSVGPKTFEMGDYI